MVLVVDDTDSLRKLLVADLSQDDRIRVEQARTGEEALEKAASTDCAVYVLDMILSYNDGQQHVSITLRGTESIRQIDADAIVRVVSQNVGVESPVMRGTHGQTFVDGDDRLRIALGDDMGGVEKRTQSESAYGAAIAI